MRKCVLVIESGPRETICAVFSNGSLEPIEYFCYAASDMKEAALSIASDLGKTGLRPSKTLLSIHSSRLSMRMLDIPIAERKKLREVASLQAEDLFVNGLEGLCVDAIPLQGSKALIVGVNKDELARELKALDGAGISVQWAGPALLSKGLLLKGLSEGGAIAALIDDDSITVAKSGEPLFFKHLDSVDDLVLSLSALEADGIKVERFYSAGSRELASMAGIKTTAAVSLRHPSLAAVALQCGEGMKESVDFLKWHADPKEEGVLRSRTRLSMALIALLALSWGAYSYLRYQNITAETSFVESDMERGYKALFPGEKPKDPGYALEVKIKELARERDIVQGRIEALKAMLELTEAAKGQDVRVHELDASGMRLNIKSEAASFEQASSFREAASKGAFFKKVSITETKPGPGGRVRFTLSAEMEPS